MALERISDLAATTSPPQDSLLEVSEPVGSPPTGYQSRKVTISDLLPVGSSHDGSGVIPPSTTTAGWAITSNYNTGRGGMDLWSTVNSAGLNENGFNFRQKIGASTHIELAALYGDTVYTQYDLYSNDVVVQLLAVAGDAGYIGTYSPLILYSAGVNALTFDINQKGTFEKPLAIVGFAFAGLPAGPVAGTIAYITDSNTTTWGATVAGGGANKVLAWFNGTNWKVIGI